MKFERAKSKYVNARREYLKQQNMVLYKQTVKESKEIEEQCFEEVLADLYKKLDINAKIFQDSIDYY